MYIIISCMHECGWSWLGLYVNGSCVFCIHYRRNCWLHKFDILNPDSKFDAPFASFHTFIGWCSIYYLIHWGQLAHTYVIDLSQQWLRYWFDYLSCQTITPNKQMMTYCQWDSKPSPQQIQTYWHWVSMTFSFKQLHCTLRLQNIGLLMVAWVC